VRKVRITNEMIDPQFYAELGILPQILAKDEVGKGSISQYMEYPTSGSDRRFVMQHHWRGRSLSKHEPIIIRRDNIIEIVPISWFFKETERNDQIKVENVEVLTSEGFQLVAYAIRHRLEGTKRLRIHTNRGIVEITEDHSLFKDGLPIKGNELKINDVIDTIQLPKIEVGHTKIDNDLAWLLGLFLAEGNKHRNHAKITQKDWNVIDRIKKIADKYGLEWHFAEDGIEIQWLPFFDKCFIPAHCQDRNYRPSYWKTLPSFIWSWDLDGRKSLLEGFILGDGLHSRLKPDFATTSKCLALGIMLLIKSIQETDFYTYLQELPSPSGNFSKVYRITCVSNSHSRSKRPGTITKIEQISSLNPDIYVYDIETKTHDFLGGLGRLRAHNSVHIDFRMEMNDHLVGWSILDNPPGTPEVQTLEEARAELKKLDWKFQWKNQNVGLRAETKCKSEFCDEWKYDLIKCENDIIYVKERSFESLSELEQLARQPKEWMGVQGVVKPGEVGATKEKEGVLLIVEKGHFWEGAQKPYFHEYFIKTDLGNLFPKGKWIRIIVRGVRVAKIDPETKKPKPGQYEMLWRTMIPSDQVAYALKRGIKKGWKPPKGVIPIPPDQRTGELWDAWQKFMEGKKETKTEELVAGKFTLHMNSYMGQIVVRAVPHIEYYLRLQFGGKVRSWFLDGNPIRRAEMAALYEGKVNPKWMTFEGALKPGEPYNPTKTLKAQMVIIDSGNVQIDEFMEEGKVLLKLKMNGKQLKGNWLLEQEEEGADIFIFKKAEEKEELIAGEFVLHRHYWDKKEHWDIRIKVSEEPKNLIEWNLWKNPLEAQIEEPIPAVVKTCDKPLEWFIKEGKGVPRKVYDVQTYVDVLDTGKINLIEYGEGFMSMEFGGNLLRGYWVLKKDPEGKWFFVKSKLPEPHQLGTVFGSPTFDDHVLDLIDIWIKKGLTEESLKELQESRLYKDVIVEQNDLFEKFALETASRGIKLPHIRLNPNWWMDEAAQMVVSSHLKFYPELEKNSPYQIEDLGNGNPSTGSYYSPFLREQKQGWDYYWVRLYDIKRFTRCVANWKEYLPDLALPDFVEDILVCLYQKPGTVHGARVSAIKIKGADTDFNKVSSWIREKKLHTWAGELIRKPRKETEI